MVTKVKTLLTLMIKGKTSKSPRRQTGWVKPNQLLKMGKKLPTNYCQVVQNFKKEIVGRKPNQLLAGPRGLFSSTLKKPGTRASSAPANAVADSTAPLYT